MSRKGTIRRAGGRTARRAAPFVWGLAIAAWFGPALSGANAQNVPAPPALPAAPATPLPTPVPPPPTLPALPALPPGAVDAPGTASTAPATPPPIATAPPVYAQLPDEVQVVRFHAPEGVVVEVVQPNPEPAPTGDGHGALTTGLRVGVPYRLKVSNVPERPGAEVYPVIEVVGHLHRPQNVDPGKFPIRVALSLEDLYDTIDRGRLVTQVIYLEDPALAIPIKMTKDEVPLTELSPSEDPLRVAAKLGRVMAIFKVGGRQPIPGDPFDAIFSAGNPAIGGPCPFTGPGGEAPCKLPCGPVYGTPPPPGRPWMPRDEYLCDGGDHGAKAGIAGDGGLAGIDPKDAVVRFHAGDHLRVLPTNVVCIYAPRFAATRVSLGTNLALAVEGAVREKHVTRQITEAVREGPMRLTLNQGAELARHRARASGLSGGVRAGVHTELRVLSGFSNADVAARYRLVQEPDLVRERTKAVLFLEKMKAEGIKTAESAVVTGIVEGASQTIMSWPARETVGVETPPNAPGLAVYKSVSASDAESGDELTFVIRYRNMGNTPIRSVSIVDSLLPRFDYVPGSAEGPEGTVFTAGENRAGAMELRWEIPGTVAPGAEGLVTFRAAIR
ncbi:MAG: hypothetical protein AB7I30_20670 [Isosphaeraceae bacterium]